MAALVLAAAAASVSGSAPTVCTSPLNKRFETPCATTVAVKGPVAVRQYGAAEAVTLVITSDLDPGFPLTSALEFGAVMIFKYFTNSPGGQVPPGEVLNRTTPLTIRKNADKGWTVWMAAAHSQFPAGPPLPTPAKYEELSALLLPGSTGQNQDAYFAVVNLTTPSFPTEAEWMDACALATAPGALPRKFAVDGRAPFPSAIVIFRGLEVGHG
jgi:hypothetical protein